MNSADQFETIVAEHYEPLFRFAMSLTRSECDACDLTQQTFCVWAKKGNQLRDPSKVKVWLFTTLHRAFLAAQRKQSRFPNYELDEAADELLAYSAGFEDRADSSQVLSALAQVDEVYQAAVALYYLDDYSYHEIAEILEVPMGTVKSRIARGIRQLRKILGVTEPKPDPALASGRAGAGGSGDDGVVDPSQRNPACRSGGACASSGSLGPSPVSGSPGTQPARMPSDGCRGYAQHALEEYRRASSSYGAGQTTKATQTTD